MRILIAVAGWLVSLALLALLALSLNAVLYGTTGATAVRLMGPLWLALGFAALTIAAIAFNPLINHRLRFLKTGFRQFLLGLVLAGGIGLFAISPLAAWQIGEDMLNKHDARGAITPLSYAAALGPAGAKHELALAYHDLGPDPATDGKYIEALLAAARAGVNNAKLMLGGEYASGKRTARNPAEAERWYKDVMAHGYSGETADAAAGLADLYAKTDPKRAAEMLDIAAKAGNDRAAFNLALMYENGEGVDRDYPRAVALYRRAADEENRSAQNNLGNMYLSGKGVPRDAAQAERLFLEAAKSDDPKLRDMATANAKLAASFK